MKLNSFRSILFAMVVYSLGTAGLFGPTHAYAMTPEQYDSFMKLELADRPETIVTTLGAMNRAILAKINGRPFTAHQFVGYSGATFADLERYKADFKKRAIELSIRSKAELGADAVAVFVLGASVDGFGIAYDLLNEMIKAGELKDAVVTGMASNEAISYHLEGLEKGWGHVISPHQSIAYFRDTYTDGKGNRSWELKSSEGGESDTPKILKDLSRFQNAGFMTFNVFGGGVQAFNETLEMILEARNRPHKVFIDLFVGHRAGKVKKDTGYRGADMLAYVLAKNPFLLNDKIEVLVRRFTGDVKIRDYKRTSNYKTIEVDIARASAKISELKNLEITPEVQAEINYFEVLSNLDNLPLREIEKFRVRSSHGLAKARSRLSGGTGAGNQPAVEALADTCANCAADVDQILGQFRSVKSCDGLLGQ